MIKTAFFDIDGTLVSFLTHQVSEGTVCAFDRLHRQGIRTFISTGRPECLIPPMPVTFDGYVTMNGGYCFMGDKVLYKNPIPQAEADRWLRYVMDNNLCTMIFTEHEMFVNTYDDPVANALCDEIKFQMPPLLPLEEMYGREAYQFIGVMDTSRDAEVEISLPHCRLPRWHSLFTDIINVDNSKAVGIESILRHLGVGREECICFGDGANDIEMLEYCGIGVAMGNAPEEVRSHADYVTTSVDDEGIEQALLALSII